VDEGDTDPATFFDRLAQSVPARAARLPSVRADRMADLAGFAHRFFKAFLELIPGLEIVVFDDFQRAAEGCPLAMLVGELARVDPSPDPLREGLPCMLSLDGRAGAAFSPRIGLSVVVLSHLPPPAVLAKEIAYGDLTRLGWKDLQLDPESPAGPVPPAPRAAARPQPIQITTLGRFEVAVSGATLGHKRRAQRRVLDLLKVIVALGGEGVSRDAVAAALWPESEGDAARNALEITLHRLRKLLGYDEAVQLAQGTLRLNRELVSVDAASFERLVVAAFQGCEALDLGAAERALALYAGPFLRNEDDASWLLPARERLRSRYVRLVIRMAEHLERAGAPRRAAEIYAVALEAEPLTEDLYRRLMVVLASQERRAEALEAYRRCRRLLLAVSGIAPSRETEALHRAIANTA
jgi:DNA-binding SARP family transcriptional activator